jgi:TQXA domain-containing protein
MRLRRVGAALIGATVALMLSALPAAADPVKGEVQVSVAEPGPEVNLVDTEGHFSTGMPGLKVGDEIIKTYCIEFLRDLDHKHPQMVEAPWDAYPNPSSPFVANRAKINWLLHNSYPFLTIEKLRKELEANGVVLEHQLSTLEAVAGTQAATWHFSDNKNLDRDNPTVNPTYAKNVLALYDFLIGSKNVGMGTQPSPALEITPDTLAGQTGTLVGPFKVATTADKLTLTKNVPAGVTITDKAGMELAADAITNGTEVFFKVPAGATAGEGTFDLKGTGSVAIGRVFVGEDNKKHPTQSLIVAEVKPVQVADSAKASWTVAPPTTTSPPAPQGGTSPALANTGVSIIVPISIGVLLLLAGGGALLFLRRRGRA